MAADQSITAPALEAFALRLTLAQLNHDPDALGIGMDDIARSGPGFFWGVAALLSAAAANHAVQACGGDRQAAARKAAQVCREGNVQPTEYAPIAAAGWRLVLVQLRNPNALGDVLHDIESRGLLHDAVAFLNGMVAQSVVQERGGDREAARRQVAAMLVEVLDESTS
jgi:hypothetical protein